MSRLLEKIKTAFKFPNEEKFDEDFRVILKVFHFFGLYKWNHSRKSYVLTVFLQFFVLFSYGSGTLKDLYVTFRQGDISKFILTVPVLTICIGISTQCFVVVFRKSKITDVIKKLQGIHDHQDDFSMQTYRNLSGKLLRFHKILMALAALCLTIMTYSGFHNFKLILPAVYDFLADDQFYQLFLFINAVFFFLQSYLYFATEWLHVLCMIRIEANFKLLCEKIRKCAKSDDLKENEENLIKCIKYHCKILQ